MYNAMFEGNQPQRKYLVHIGEHGGGGFMISCVASNHSVGRELICVRNYSAVKCEFIWSAANTWMKLGHAPQGSDSSKSSTEWKRKWSGL